MSELSDRIADAIFESTQGTVKLYAFLEAQLDQLERDRKRLDWLERHPDVVIEMDWKGIWTVTVTRDVETPDLRVEAGSLREAIDTAIETEDE